MYVYVYVYVYAYAYAYVYVYIYVYLSRYVHAVRTYPKIQSVAVTPKPT